MRSSPVTAPRAVPVIVLPLCAALALSGCAAFPTQGPSPYQVQASAPASPNNLQYVLVQLTAPVAAMTARKQPASLGGTFSGPRGAPTLRLGVGDIVGVTIFEAAAGGLFIPAEAGSRAGNFVTLPAQEVSKNGTISVPYAGLVPAAGRTLVEVQRTIEERLKNRAIDPQAVVTLQEDRSSLVSVTGEVNAPLRFAVTRSGDRILDAITRAGGSKWPPFETYVTLQRGKRTGTVYFNRLVSDPSNNVFIQPGDTIVVSREKRAFLALGASGQNGQINFDAENLNLAEAVGRAGGVLDARGDPAETFVYRLEDRKLVEDMGFDTAAHQGAVVPVIYRVNLREPQGYFLASQFPMQDKDVLFVSNATTSEFTKFLDFLQLGANTVSDVNAARYFSR